MIQTKQARGFFSHPWGTRLAKFWLVSAVIFVWGWTFNPHLDIPENMRVTARQDAIERPACAARVSPLPRLSLTQRLIGRVVLDNEDSWRAMRAGLEQIETHPEDKLYAPVFAKCIKFQYPPSSLLTIDLLGTLLGPGAVSNAFLNSLSILLTLGMLAALWKLFALELPSPPWLADKVLPVAFALICYPVLKALELGQIQSWLNAGFAFGALLYVRDRRFLAGLIFGFMATIKPQMAILLPWALVRKDYTMSRGLLVAMGSLGLLGLARYGLAPHLEYLDVVRDLSRRGESYYANQSVNGLLLRALHLGPNAQFEFDRFAPYHPFVHAATTLSGLGLMGLAIWVSRREAKATRLLDLSLAGLCFTMASPIAWEHHYGLLPVVFLAATTCLIVNRAGLWRGLSIALAGAWILTAVRYRAVLAFADTHLNFLESHLFFGVLVLVAVLVSLRREVLTLTPSPEEQAQHATLR